MTGIMNASFAINAMNNNRDIPVVVDLTDTPLQLTREPNAILRIPRQHASLSGFQTSAITAYPYLGCSKQEGDRPAKTKGGDPLAIACT
jgi:hypothetical protein